MYRPVAARLRRNLTVDTGPGDVTNDDFVRRSPGNWVWGLDAPRTYAGRPLPIGRTDRHGRHGRSVASDGWRTRPYGRSKDLEVRPIRRRGVRRPISGRGTHTRDVAPSRRRRRVRLRRDLF